MARLPVVLALALALGGCLGASDTTAEPPTPTNPSPTPGNESVAENTPAASPTSQPPPTTTPPPPTPVALTVKLAGLYPANPAYDPPRLEAPSGTPIELTFTNTDQNPLGKHDWALEGMASAKTAVIAVGESETIEFIAPAPGEYAYFCTVEGHRERGMEGAFVVR